MTTDTPKTDAPSAPRRGRKRVASPLNEVRVVPRLQSIEERQYEVAIESPDVKAALLKYEGARARRDSISRKLCGGSTAVTVSDLARWEADISNAKENLAQLAHRRPILERHPVIASVVSNS